MHCLPVKRECDPMDVAGAYAKSKIYLREKIMNVNLVPANKDTHYLLARARLWSLVSTYNLSPISHSIIEILKWLESNLFPGR